MSKVATIPEVLEMVNDMVVPVFKATIKKAFPRTPLTGYDQGNYGDSSYEDLIVTDGRNEIKVVLSAREPLDRALLGKQVYFIATQGDKGWNGVKTKDKRSKKKANAIPIMKSSGYSEFGIQLLGADHRDGELCAAARWIMREYTSAV